MVFSHFLNWIPQNIAVKSETEQEKSRSCLHQTWLSEQVSSSAGLRQWMRDGEWYGTESPPQMRDQISNACPEWGTKLHLAGNCCGNEEEENKLISQIPLDSLSKASNVTVSQNDFIPKNKWLLVPWKVHEARTGPQQQVCKGQGSSVPQAWFRPFQTRPNISSSPQRPQVSGQKFHCSESKGKNSGKSVCLRITSITCCQLQKQSPLLHLYCCSEQVSVM